MIPTLRSSSFFLFLSRKPFLSRHIFDRFKIGRILSSKFPSLETPSAHDKSVLGDSCGQDLVEDLESPSRSLNLPRETRLQSQISARRLSKSESTLVRDYNFDTKEPPGRVWKEFVGRELQAESLDRLGGNTLPGQRLINLGAEFTELG